MNSDPTSQKFSHTSPLSFSEREQQIYRAEKMLLRQFILLKMQNHIPDHISNEEMKSWLSRGRSLNQEFQEIAEGMKVSELLMVELPWSSAKCLCMDKMEQEILEELEIETRLSQLFRRKVTLEGLQMFLPIIRSRVERDVRILLLHLSNKLLISFVASDTGTCYRRALVTKLQKKTQPFAPQMVQTVLDLLLDDADPHVEESQGIVEIMDSYLRTRMEASCALIGQQLADAAASCFCLQTCSFKDRLLSFCTTESWLIVTAVYRRFTEGSRSFHLLDFDESFFTARESVLDVINDMMEDRLQRAATIQEQLPLITEEENETPEVNLLTTENTDRKQEMQRGGVKAFFSQIWRKMSLKPSEQ